MKAIMKREYGESPNGNPFDGRWVARTENGDYIAHDKYQNDLKPRLERQGYVVEKIGE